MKQVKIAIVCVAVIVIIALFGVLLMADDTEPDYHSRDWDGDDSYRLAQLAMYYAYDMPIEGKILIINIAVNRVWSERYPDTIKAVVNDMTGGAYADMEPDYECLDAEHHVQIDGLDLSDGATEFEIVDRRIIKEGG